MKAVILAAGIGSRLGLTLPKCLTILPSGMSVLENQVYLLKQNKIKEIVVVVGFKKEIIMEKYPDLFYKYNHLFHITNTSKSLMIALENLEQDHVVWLNGDIFLEMGVLKKVLCAKGNVIGVNREKCDMEEVKYKTDKSGKIVEISKSVRKPEGEAVGVNKISRRDFRIFLESLRDCNPEDYFEKAIEISINKGINFYPVDISSYKCIEIDFIQDLERVKKELKISMK